MWHLIDTSSPRAAIGSGLHGGNTTVGFAETGFLFLEGIVAMFHQEDVGEEVFGGGVFIEATR